MKVARTGLQAVVLLTVSLLAGCSDGDPPPAPPEPVADGEEVAAPSSSTSPPAPVVAQPASWSEPLDFTGRTLQTACASAAGQGQCTAPGGASVTPLDAPGEPTHLNLTLTWDGGPTDQPLQLMFAWMPEGEDHYAYSHELTASGPSPLAVAWAFDLPPSTEHGIVVSSGQNVNLGAGGVFVVHEVEFQASGDWSGRTASAYP